MPTFISPAKSRMHPDGFANSFSKPFFRRMLEFISPKKWASKWIFVALGTITSVFFASVYYSYSQGNKPPFPLKQANDTIPLVWEQPSLTSGQLNAFNKAVSEGKVAVYNIMPGKLVEYIQAAFPAQNYPSISDAREIDSTIVTAGIVLDRAEAQDIGYIPNVPISFSSGVPKVLPSVNLLQFGHSEPLIGIKISVSYGAFSLAGFELPNQKLASQTIYFDGSQLMVPYCDGYFYAPAYYSQEIQISGTDYFLRLVPRSEDRAAQVEIRGYDADGNDILLIRLDCKDSTIACKKSGEKSIEYYFVRSVTLGSLEEWPAYNAFVDGGLLPEPKKTSSPVDALSAIGSSYPPFEPVEQPEAYQEHKLEILLPATGWQESMGKK